MEKSLMLIGNLIFFKKYKLDKLEVEKNDFMKLGRIIFGI